MLEKELLAELITGDKNAFTNLYFSYSGQVYSKILRLTKCEETSREILQELFLKVWEKRTQIDPEKPFKAYLFTIAQNLMYDHFRKVARDKVLVDSLVSSAAMYYRAEESEVFEERLECIKKAIEQLPPARKQVFKLSKIEGKSYEEIASLLEISHSTISDHIVKANRAIKKYLQAHGDVAVSLLIWLLTDL
ncbi:RNA polymerase sigma factor [Dyadobacter sp. CY323]|uniref:RNA polymerase sigma factor n=1 Tax=Dyadobacter sp. CY323 TaxID=2907302 RepID=UPI001F17CB34|nr:sigma-70 family RNA polymerase sigma factor [Dyadobacter sp. CY323]MCE6989701.1 sigma-70 family RNA polymerase sigma factor [Dyadobacter sp. CY323]